MSFSRILERCERWFVYISLILTLLLEAAFKFGIAVPAVTLEQKMALLIFNFLIVFRIVDKRLISSPKSGVGSFSDGFDHTFSANAGEVTIFANDAAKYYQFFSSKKSNIKELTLIVFDTTQAIKWMTLKERGRIQNLHIIQMSTPPSFHYAIVDSKRGMFGLFFRDGEKISALGTHFFSGSDDEGRQKLDDLAKVSSSTTTANAISSADQPKLSKQTS